MIEVVNERIGAAVKDALKRRGMTQAQLARELGMKPSNLSNMLAGHTSAMPARWQDILDRVGLDLTALPKDAPAQPPAQAPAQEKA